MSDNPYASSHLPADPVGRRPPAIRVTAIVIGFMVDLGFSLGSGLLLGIALVVWMVSQGAAPAQMEDAAGQMPFMVWGGYALGCVGSVLGGYFAATYAGVWPFRHALLTGIVSLVLGLVALPFLLASHSVLYIVFSYATIVPLYLLGGYIYSLRARPQPVPA